MPGKLQIRLLGRLQIDRDQVPVRGFESRKALALICYLAVQGCAVSRSELVALFWGDKPEAQGRANLSRVLHNNLEILPDCLKFDRDTVQLIQSDTCWIDVAVFAELAAQDDMSSLVAAVDLFQGDLLQDCRVRNCPEFETWLVTQQEVWRQRVARVLQRLIDRYYAHGGYEQALGFASRLVALDPWREEAHRQMMLMLALNGQRITALLQYETCCRILATELGVSPSEETTTLYKRIKNGVVGQVSAALARASDAEQGNTQLSSMKLSAVDASATIKQILRRLDDNGCHLLTLAGPSSENASYVACRIAEEQRRMYRDGVYTISLSPSKSNGAFLATLTDTVELKPDVHQDPRTQLLNHLRDKDLLLVLTDFDPAFGQAALLEDILKRAPHVKILVTSRNSLNLAMEWIYDV